MIYVGNIWFVVVCSLIYWLYYERIMFAEESFLRGKFGQAYLDWSVDVPSFWPRNLKWQTPDVSFFNAQRIENVNTTGFFAVFCKLGIDFSRQKPGCTALELGIPRWCPFGNTHSQSTFLIFITLRSLKRYSRVLHVEGR